MKLRARVTRPELFRDICGSLAALNKTCIMRFDPEKFQPMTVVNNGGLQCWASPIQSDHLFGEYLVTSRTNDVIMFEINVDLLYRALVRIGAAVNSSVVTLKLKKDKDNRTSHLTVTFEVEGWDSWSHVSHKLPVQLLRESQRLREPMIPDPHMFFMAPEPVSSLNRVSDRFRNLSTVITVSAQTNGELTLSMDDADALGSAKVSSTWENIAILRDPVPQDDATPSLRGALNKYGVRIRTKDWYNVLQVYNFARKVTVGIRDHELLILHCLIGPQELEDSECEVLFYYLSNYEN